MATVAFWFDAPVEYSGGLNYIRNLLYALSLVNDGSVTPLVFFSSDIPDFIEKDFARYATVVRTRLLQRKTCAWLVHKVLLRVTGRMPLVTRLLRAHRVIVVSHVWFVYRGAPFRIVGWIPDFQYLHLPEFFPGLDTAEETKRNQRIIEQSDLVVLSSEDALRDFERIAPPGRAARGRVLRFVSQPRSTDSVTVPTREHIEATYDFRGRYFYLPNQFWVHKNHMVVLRAVKHLKDRGIEILVLCTGNTRDYRLPDTKYMDEIVSFIERNQLHSNFRVLGLIAYADVLYLMRHAVAVLNPSLFEGWSSSVEEAKSFGTPVILSRIAVHVEQDPPRGRYFDPHDVGELACILAELWIAPEPEANGAAQAFAQDALHERTTRYGLDYLALLAELAALSERVALEAAQSA